MTKAVEACMTSPSVMVPARYFGAHRMIGTTGARYEVAVGDDGRAQVLPAHRPPLHDHAAERLAQGAALLGLAPEKGDALAILPQPRRGVSEFRLGLVLALRDLTNRRPMKSIAVVVMIE